MLQKKLPRSVVLKKEIKIVKDEAAYQLKVCSALFGLLFRTCLRAASKKMLQGRSTSLLNQKKRAIGGLDNDDLCI